MATNALRTYTVRPSTTGAPNTSVPVALVAATAKTVVSCLGSAADTICLVGYRISFNGVDPAQVPALVEIGVISAHGTDTDTTPQQRTGSPVASSVTAGYNNSVEATYVRIIDSFYVPIFNGHLTEWLPLGFEPSVAVSQGFAMRVTAPAAATCLPSLIFGE